MLKQHKSKKWKKAKCRNLYLVTGPRLYFTGTEEVDGREDLYLSDIILFNDLKVSTNRQKNMLMITCPNSLFTYKM